MTKINLINLKLLTLVLVPNYNFDHLQQQANVELIYLWRLKLCGIIHIQKLSISGLVRLLCLC
jgi:hypothetical protein